MATRTPPKKKAPNSITSAQSRAFRTPVRAPRTPPKKTAPNSITKPYRASETSRLAPLAKTLAPSTYPAVPSRYVPTPYRVTPIVDEDPNMLFSEGESDRSPLLRKRERDGFKVGEPGHEELRTEFVIGPLPGPPPPKRPKLMVGTSGEGARGICSRNSTHPKIAPRKWRPPFVLFPSTCSLPIWTRPTEWDNDDEDTDDNSDDDEEGYDDDDEDEHRDKVSLPPAQAL